MRIIDKIRENARTASLVALIGASALTAGCNTIGSNVRTIGELNGDQNLYSLGALSEMTDPGTAQNEITNDYNKPANYNRKPVGLSEELLQQEGIPPEQWDNYTKYKNR